MQFIRAFMLLTLLGSLCVARADGPDDEYYRIFAIIDQADTLSASGKSAPAQAKYQEALKDLTEFKRLNPLWNPKAVAYRLNYLAGKLAPPEKTVVPETGTTKAAPQAGSGVKAGSSTAGVQVKLIKPGAEPRKVLRLRPQTGDQQSLGMTLKMSMAMAAGGGEMPAIKMPAMLVRMEVAVKSISAEGDIAFETTIADASVANDPDAATMAGGLDAAMTSIKGMTISGIVTDRGISKAVDFKMPPGSDPQARQTLEQMKTAMSQVSLPEEEVGVGAQWEVKRKLSTQGLTVDQTETYEITALENGAVTLRTGNTQHAANQKMESPAMPGMKMDISKMETKATGTTTLQLGKLMPTSGTMDGHTEMNMSMDVGGQKQAMTMKMDMTAKIESK